MIDHKSFTDAYNTHSEWMTYLARSLYRTDPDKLVADTWTRVWIGRERIKEIKPELLKTILYALVKDYWKIERREQKRLENKARILPGKWEDCELPEIDLKSLSGHDQFVFQRLWEHCQQHGKMVVQDAKIPKATLSGFRKRMRERFLEKVS